VNRTVSCCLARPISYKIRTKRKPAKEERLEEERLEEERLEEERKRGREEERKRGRERSEEERLR
jgi:hypothetical protein